MKINTILNYWNQKIDHWHCMSLSKDRNKSNPLSFSHRIGSDEEDNDSDQEDNQDLDLETAVSRQEIALPENSSPISSEFQSNGHEYILINRSINNHIVPKMNKRMKINRICTFFDSLHSIHLIHSFLFLNLLFLFVYCISSSSSKETKFSHFIPFSLSLSI